MRNSINALDINVVVDRIDRAVVVAGIRVQHGVLPLPESGASYPRAGACATKPGHKTPGTKTGSCKLPSKRLHLKHPPMPAMQERLLQRWRSRRSFTSSQRLASIA
jgi:hypothetical protein